MQRIKKNSTGNQYLLTKDNVWVRDFTSMISPFDLNRFSAISEYGTFLKNETANERHDVPSLDFGSFRFGKAVIVSDGYKFEEKQEELRKLRSDVAIIATNKTLVKWKIDRKIDFFLVNNPYPECKNYLPEHRYYPRCVVSTRTCPEFVEKYKSRGGMVLSYLATTDKEYSSPCKSYCRLDDYRNPICAGVNLAYKLGVKKLLLFCCDDSFGFERPSAIKLSENLWTYPQHSKSQRIVDAMLYWYKKIKWTKLADHSSGILYEHAPYIPLEETCKFFED